MERRNTIQRDLVLNTVMDMKSHVTADDVYDEICKNYSSISKGTVYRNLNVLAQEGRIKRIEVPNGSDCFDFKVSEHYHVICTECHKVFDVDMDRAVELADRIINAHGVRIDGFDILFKGVCSECREK